MSGMLAYIYNLTLFIIVIIITLIIIIIIILSWYDHIIFHYHMTIKKKR